MGARDFQLRHLRHDESAKDHRVHILVQLVSSTAKLDDPDFEETSRAGDVIAGSIQVRYLDRLEQKQNVVVVEGSRHLKDELDDSILAIKLIDSSDVRQIPGFGKGAIIGVIDSGFELTHPCFCDEEGNTRVLTAWDQVNRNEEVGQSPSGFNYGVEYGQAYIDRRARAGKTITIKNDEGAGSHGTAVAAIAAGNGMPFGIYQGMAPEAELVLVSYKNDVQIGGSAFVMDAICYILKIAASQNKPVVINLSQGDNLGAHDGSSLLERGIDNLLDQERLLIVNSAGNGRGGSRHAEGRLVASAEYPLSFSFKQGKEVNGDTIDIWYQGADRFSVALTSPTGWQSDFVHPDCAERIVTPEGNTAFVYSELDYPTNHDNRISVIFEKGNPWASGAWGLTLRPDNIGCGDFHAWTDRPNAVSAIVFSDPSDNSTVTLPGTARNIITVSGFVSRPVNADAGRIRGDLAGGTSLGPTRDDRRKPDITAPSSMLMVPKLSGPGNDSGPSYGPQSGTSMAAPHLAGIIALLWALKPALTPESIRSALHTTAVEDKFTGSVPNMRWGKGKVDAGALYRALFLTINDQRNGETTMAEQRIPFEINVKNDRGDEMPFSLEIIIRDGSFAGIEGRSGDELVEGTLNLRKKSNADGGDQCWVCGRLGCEEVSPCPN